MRSRRAEAGRGLGLLLDLLLLFEELGGRLLLLLRLLLIDVGIDGEMRGLCVLLLLWWLQLTLLYGVGIGGGFCGLLRLLLLLLLHRRL